MIPSGRHPRTSWIVRSRHSRMLLAASIVVLLFLAVSFGREILRRYEIKREIGNLQNEIDVLARRNSELTDLMAYLNTNSFQEREARVKLGLQKAGESVVLIPRDQVNAHPSVIPAASKAQPAEETPAAKWWTYFFGNQ
ncbi:MAG: septum formation initiator family protein [Candidatus Kerfeldbacteria bacterium]|nr:septum formation initiator family protein [Candidatus Kerfeldbacteria bacterium]